MPWYQDCKELQVTSDPFVFSLERSLRILCLFPWPLPHSTEFSWIFSCEQDRRTPCLTGASVNTTQTCPWVYVTDYVVVVLVSLCSVLSRTFLCNFYCYSIHGPPWSVFWQGLNTINHSMNALLPPPRPIPVKQCGWMHSNKNATETDGKEIVNYLSSIMLWQLATHSPWKKDASRYSLAKWYKYLTAGGEGKISVGTWSFSWFKKASIPKGSGNILWYIWMCIIQCAFPFMLYVKIKITMKASLGNAFNVQVA